MLDKRSLPLAGKDGMRYDRRHIYPRLPMRYLAPVLGREKNDPEIMIQK
jgi:hypothetical protein